MYSQLGETELNIADMDDLFEIKALKKNMLSVLIMKINLLKCLCTD